MNTLQKKYLYLAIIVIAVMATCCLLTSMFAIIAPAACGFLAGMINVNNYLPGGKKIIVFIVVFISTIIGGSILTIIRPELLIIVIERHASVDLINEMSTKEPVSFYGIFLICLIFYPVFYGIAKMLKWNPDSFLKKFPR